MFTLRSLRVGLLTGILANLSTIWDTVSFWNSRRDTYEIIGVSFPKKNIFESFHAFNLIPFLETQSTLKRSHLCLFFLMASYKLLIPHHPSIHPRCSAAHHPSSPSLSPSLWTQMCQSWWVVSRVRWQRARATKERLIGSSGWGPLTRASE